MNSLAEAISVCNQMNDWPERVYVKDSDRKFVCANLATAIAAGEEDPEKLIGKSDTDLFESPHSRATSVQEVALISGEQNIVTCDEFETWPYGGRIDFVHSTKKAIVTPSGERVGIFGITRKLTVAEREDFLRRYISCNDPAEAGSSDSDAGFWWRNITRRTQPPSHFSPEFLQAFPPTELRSRQQRGLAQMVENVHESDKRQLMRFIHAALAGHKLRVSPERKGASRGATAFRYLSGDKSARRPEWIQGEAFFTHAGEDEVVVVNHRRITQPDALALLGQTLASDFPAFVFVKDSDRKFKFMNDRLLNALGKQLDDVLNETDEGVGFEPEECKSFRRGDISILDDGQPSFVAYWESLTFPSGLRRVVTIKMPIPAYVFDPSARSEGVHVFGISVDATLGLEFFENAIFTPIVEATEEPAYIKRLNDNSEFVYAAANNPFCSLVGKSLPEIIGRTAGEIWKDTNPELIGEMDRQDHNVWSGEKVARHERLTRLPDGTFQKRLTDKTLLRDEHRNPMAILGISREIMAPRLVGQSKNVAVIFCDIRKFSDLAAKLTVNVQILFDFLGAFYRTLMSLRHKHSCDFVKYLGDGAMIVAGGRDSTNDYESSSAARAANFALDLQEQFALVVNEWQHNYSKELTVIQPIRLGIGIHFDQALFGELRAEGGDGEYSVFGPSVSVAQRLESAAGKMDGAGILISGNMRDELLKATPHNMIYQIGSLARYAAKDCEVNACTLSRDRAMEFQTSSIS